MIDKKTVLSVAILARLSLKEEEINLYQRQLADVLSYIDKLNQLDVRDVEPTFHAISVENVLREDKLQESLSVENVLSNAPSKERGCFKVPKIIS